MAKRIPNPSANPAHVANIIAVLKNANAEEVNEGLDWYEMANTFARGLSVKYNVTIEQSAGIIAALSPQISWERNQIIADEFIRSKGRKNVQQTGPNLAKARAILRGENILNALTTESSPNTGHKVRNFYACIVNPQTDAVCIDRHAYQLAEAEAKNDDQARSNALRKVGFYDSLANAYREAANIMGMLPHQAQAVSWVAWRNIKHNPSRLSEAFS